MIDCCFLFIHCSLKLYRSKKIISFICSELPQFTNSHIDLLMFNRKKKSWVIMKNGTFSFLFECSVIAWEHIQLICTCHQHPFVIYFMQLICVRRSKYTHTHARTEKERKSIRKMTLMYFSVSNKINQQIIEINIRMRKSEKKIGK